MDKLKRRRFSRVELVVIVSVVAALVVGGGFIWYRMSQKDPAPTPQAAQEEAKFLTVTEWNVRLPLSPDLVGAYYDAGAALPNARSLRARKLDSEPNCVNSTSGIVMLYRVQKDEVSRTNRAKKYTELYQGKVIDDHFFFMVPATQGCTSNPEKVAVFEKAKAAYLAALPNIEKL